MWGISAHGKWKKKNKNEALNNNGWGGWVGEFCGWMGDDVGGWMGEVAGWMGWWRARCLAGQLAGCVLATSEGLGLHVN